MGTGKPPTVSTGILIVDQTRLLSFSVQGSMQGSTAAGLSHILQEKEATIASLQTTLQGKEKDEKEMAEQITNLSRYTLVSHCPPQVAPSLSLSCRQVEDLQFQLEEQDIISGDKLEVVEEGTQARVAELEEQLAREKEESSKMRQQLLQVQVNTHQELMCVTFITSRYVQ